MIVERALLTAGVVCLLFSVLVLGTLAYNPRLWSRSAPPAIREAVEPLTARERRDRLALLVPLVGVTFGIPVWSVLSVEAALGGITFQSAFVHLWLAFVAFNLYDLVVLDWLVTVRWQPRFVYTPEIEPHLHHNTYRYHLALHAKSTVALTAIAAVLAALVAW